MLGCTLNIGGCTGSGRAGSCPPLRLRALLRPRPSGAPLPRVSDLWESPGTLPAKLLMARKTRRQKQRSAARQTAPARAPGTRPDQAVGSTESFSLTGGADLAPAAADDDDEAIAEEAEAIEALTEKDSDSDSDSDAVATTETAAAAASASRATAAATAAAVAAPAGTPPRRRIERLSQATPVATRAGRPGRGPSNAAAMFQPLDTEDAAIPFDRVPYVPADLRRVLVIALMMVGLIIIAAIVVTHVVH